MSGGIRTFYIGLEGSSPTRRNLSDSDTTMIVEIAARYAPPMAPTRLIEEIVSIWCAERRCAHEGTSQTVPQLPEGE